VRRRLFLAVILFGTACTQSNVSSPTAQPSRARSPQSQPCRVTLPDGSYRPGDPAGLGNLGYGNGELWVGLWSRGHIRATRDDLNRRGEITMKIPWDRAVKGRLGITGRRLDQTAPPLRARVLDYGSTEFQPSRLIFPTEGCWEVTGRVREITLTLRHASDHAA
jgi:hypothetical protein